MSAVREANGIEVSTTNGETLGARRLAAELDRGDPVVDWIKNKNGPRATVWLNEEAGLDSFYPPDGWSIDSVVVTTPENVGVRVSRDD